MLPPVLSKTVSGIKTEKSFEGFFILFLSDMFDMFSSKPGQINNNQTPANNPFLETNQVKFIY